MTQDRWAWLREAWPLAWFAFGFACFLTLLAAAVLSGPALNATSAWLTRLENRLGHLEEVQADVTEKLQQLKRACQAQ